MNEPAALNLPHAAVGRGRAAAEALLALLGAALLALGIADMVQNDALLVSARVEQAVVGGVAVAAALATAAVARLSERWTAWLLGLGLLLSLGYSWLDEAPPVAALPLLVALVLVLRPISAREAEPGVDYSTSHTAVSIVSVVLMVPIGLFYAALALLVPGWAIAVGQSLYVVLLVATLWLAVRRSYWAAAGPVLAVTIWFVGLWAGETLLGWTA